MVTRIHTFFALAILVFAANAYAQTIKPGFSKEEYLDALKRCSVEVSVPGRAVLPVEKGYTRVYRAPETGLHNKWELWLNDSKTIMVINLRGTVGAPDSWLENFYCAMIPATGTLHLADGNNFQYKFAEDPKATVHVGWAIGACSLLPDIMAKIRLYYASGIKQVYVEGHSQGGALAFLITSYLHYKIAAGELPADLVMKTYCSAAPKPGNLYYAYDFDYITAGGWAFRVVNAADWVPESPFAIQTLRDVNPTNPYIHTKEALRKQKLLIRLYGGHVYNQLNRVSDKVQRKYEKYFGRLTGKLIKKYLPEYKAPQYAHNENYTPAGVPVVMEPDSVYYKSFPANDTDIFRHHLYDAYYYLAQKLK